MKKINVKLIAVILQLTLAISVVAMSSYAWMVLSNNPAAEGIQITIGGGNTILVAADLTEEVDGITYHYPDAFRDSLNFTQHESYSYLNDLSGLTPVSTADGLSWFIPEYYDLSDQEVQDGTILSGTMKSIQEFTVDDLLKYANLSSGEAQLAADGSYIYLDFWVVSPGQDYALRVSTSTGEDESGSYAIDLMQAFEIDGGYTLADDGSDATACVRVGFLVNPDEIIDNTMLYYQSSATYSNQYTKLRGSYIEPNGGSYVYSSRYRFTIYEPNGDGHFSGAEVEDGTYVITKPIGLVDGIVSYANIQDRLTVQTGSGWSVAESGTGTKIEQMFQTALLGSSLQGLTDPLEITRLFYNDYLGGQVDPYVTNGLFVKSTETLYTLAENNATGAEYLSGNYVAGATNDVYIVKLEKNVPQRIRLFIWLEGEDVDCINSASASSFAIQIELAGSNADEE